VEPAETAVARERLCKPTPVAGQWLGDRHVKATIVAHATIAKLLEAVFPVWSPPFSMRSVPGLYGKVFWTGLLLRASHAALPT
jgi:hypothetical protein